MRCLNVVYDARQRWAEAGIELTPRQFEEQVLVRAVRYYRLVTGRYPQQDGKFERAFGMISETLLRRRLKR